MPLKLLHSHHHHHHLSTPKFFLPSPHPIPNSGISLRPLKLKIGPKTCRIPPLMPSDGTRRRKPSTGAIVRPRKTAISASLSPLDLTEDNINHLLADAKVELGQLFDTEVGITGKAELAELDGPYVKIRLTGRFWHKRSTVIARLGNYLKQRIPEILEVDIEDEKQLDDSPANF